jgi:hypothetical protein
MADLASAIANGDAMAIIATGPDTAELAKRIEGQAQLAEAHIVGSDALRFELGLDRAEC